MSVFADLNRQFEKHDHALDEQHTLLIKAVSLLAPGFNKYLGLSSPHWFHEDGKKGENYVRIGTGSPQSFKEKHWSHLSITSGIVDFSLALTLEPGAASVRRFTVVFEASVEFSSAGYEFRFSGVQGPIELSVEEVKSGQYDKVYDALTHRIYQMFDPASVQIHR